MSETGERSTSGAGELAPGVVVRGAKADYALRAKIREGGFGQVWRAVAFAKEEAREPGIPVGEIGRAVAVKFATSEVGLRSIRSEAELAERLRGLPGVVPVEELIEGAHPCLVMAWGGDRSLRDVLGSLETRDDRARAAAILMKLARVVGHVHLQRIAHGDLKPENVLVDLGRPRLIDFGLARVLRTTRLDRSLSASLRTQDGLEGGTLAYLPPEAVKGAEPSLPGDVYALGVMLHEVLLGRRPDKAQELSSLGLPEEVTDVLRKALAFDPAERYASAGALAVELEAIESALTASGASRAIRVVGRWARAGLAAFFVTLRYLSVVVLLGAYLGILVLAVTVHPAFLGTYFFVALLHICIRWEGPETTAEAALRNTGNVVAPGKKAR